jgi:hypothetical protein
VSPVIGSRTRARFPGRIRPAGRSTASEASLFAGVGYRGAEITLACGIRQPTVTPVGGARRRHAFVCGRPFFLFPDGGRSVELVRRNRV